MLCPQWRLLSVKGKKKQNLIIFEGKERKLALSFCPQLSLSAFLSPGGILCRQQQQTVVRVVGYSWRDLSRAVKSHHGSLDKKSFSPPNILLMPIKYHNKTNRFPGCYPAFIIMNRSMCPSACPLEGVIIQKIKLGISSLSTSFKMIMGVPGPKVKGIAVSQHRLSPESPCHLQSKLSLCSGLCCTKNWENQVQISTCALDAHQMTLGQPDSLLSACHKFHEEG